MASQDGAWFPTSHKLETLHTRYGKIVRILGIVGCFFFYMERTFRTKGQCAPSIDFANQSNTLILELGRMEEPLVELAILPRIPLECRLLLIRTNGKRQVSSLAVHLDMRRFIQYIRRWLAPPKVAIRFWTETRKISRYETNMELESWNGKRRTRKTLNAIPSLTGLKMQLGSKRPKPIDRGNETEPVAISFRQIASSAFCVHIFAFHLFKDEGSLFLFHCVLSSYEPESG